MLKIKYFFFVNIFLFITLNGQVSNVRYDNDVYKYLSKLSQKGVITFNELLKPLSRRYIAEKLVEADKKNLSLTPLQKEELKFYKKEFGYEIARILTKDSRWKSDEKVKEKNLKITKKNKKDDLFDKSWKFDVLSSSEEQKLNINKKEIYTFVKNDPYKRWRFFAFQNDLMNLNVNPILGYNKGKWEDEDYSNFYIGLSFNGEIDDIVGFNFELKMRRIKPGTMRSYPLFDKFSPNTAIELQLSDRERIEATSVNVDIGAKWDWGSFTIGKNHLNWGYAENGKLVLSERPPSFPYIRLDIEPTDWFSFNYIHGWLNSEVYDSSSFHASWRVRIENTDKKSFISKYIALHSVTFRFWDGISLSMGESAVYSGNLQASFLIPIMFFDLADQFTSNNDNYAGASTQLFLAINSKNHIKNTHLYGSFHADELTPEGLFDPETQYYKFGFTLGGYVIDLPINNLGVRLEFTKIYPGNYRHFVPTLTYETSSTIMGHWMGDNGDLFYAAIDYTIIRGLKLKFWTQYIRKGTEGLGNRMYKIQKPQPPFLFTDNIRDRKNYRYYGIDIDYEILPKLWVKGYFHYIEYQQQYKKGKFNSTFTRNFELTLGYGL
ncbi:MAG: hypothetical protein CR986_07360 [Ignavibacteriae bacterium]|nr:MAG: hypothetical protein CR986_07360 [Ignavibacteriota bacterium]